MVPYSPSKWYHILLRYGTIFYHNMVPFSKALSLVLKIKTTIMLFQNNPFSSSKWVSLPFQVIFFLFKGEGWKKWGGSIVSVMHKPHSVAIRITILLLYLTFLNLLRCGNNDGIVKLFNDFSKRSDMRTKEVGDVVVVKGCLIDNIL